MLVKPSYNIKYVERIYTSVKRHLTYDFNMICLTDSEWKTDYPIQFIDVSGYELDTWWNKVALFSKDISGKSVNLYFDLDIEIVGNIDFLVQDVDIHKLAVVDTLWKDGNFVEEGLKQKRGSSFFCYGNTSVMGWTGESHDFLFERLLEDPFITVEHFGDDTYINGNGNIKYFQPLICDLNSSRYMKSIKDKRIIIHIKDLRV